MYYIIAVSAKEVVLKKNCVILKLMKRKEIENNQLYIDHELFEQITTPYQEKK